MVKKFYIIQNKKSLNQQEMLNIVKLKTIVLYVFKLIKILYIKRQIYKMKR